MIPTLVASYDLDILHECSVYGLDAIPTRLTVHEGTIRKISIFVKL